MHSIDLTGDNGLIKVPAVHPRRSPAAYTPPSTVSKCSLFLFPPTLAASARWECVLHKFDAVQEGELSLAPGAWVQVLDHHDDGWLTVSTADGETGLVPRSYVTSTRLTKPLTPKA